MPCHKLLLIFRSIAEYLHPLITVSHQVMDIETQFHFITFLFDVQGLPMYFYHCMKAVKYRYGPGTYLHGLQACAAVVIEALQYGGFKSFVIFCTDDFVGIRLDKTGSETCRYCINVHRCTAQCVIEPCRIIIEEPYNVLFHIDTGM